MGLNYTSDFYRINEWYKIWLPDDAVKKGLQDTKTVYDVRIRYANNTNSTFSFHGPPGAVIFIIIYVIWRIYFRNLYTVLYCRWQIWRENNISFTI
jgi:hypothetical protein